MYDSVFMHLMADDICDERRHDKGLFGTLFDVTMESINYFFLTEKL